MIKYTTEMKIVDAKGLQCPMPLIQTKKAITQQKKDEALKVLIDNKASKKNVMQFLSDNKIEFEYNNNNGIHELIINKQDTDITEASIDEYCDVELPTKNDFILLFAKSTIGEGAEELGKMLVGGFLNTFLEMEKYPQKIIFMNSGIDLVLKDSHVLSTLKEFELKGVELLVCGTCLDYYEKIDDIGVGKVSNAYDILNATLSNVKVLSF